MTRRIVATLGGADAEGRAHRYAARVGGTVERAPDDHDRPRFHVLARPDFPRPRPHHQPEEPRCPDA